MSTLDAKGLAAYFEITEDWVRRHTKELPHTRLGHFVRFTDEDIAEIKKKYGMRPGRTTPPPASKKGRTA